MRIGPYETLGELGRGGMGVVYRARSPEGGEVAIKVVLKLDPEKLARFDRERRLLSALGEDKGFVPFLAAGATPQGPYVVMPLLTGGTLRDRFQRGPQTIEATLELGRALTRALGEAHALGIVHRDLKPENVLFDARGRPFVADLGLAKHFRDDVSGASLSADLSRSGAFRGTPGYMAPEQATDARSVGPPADVYALGAILYEGLTGRPAFEGSLIDVLAKVTEGRLEPLRRLRPDVPEWLAAAVERALAKDPAARPIDALALGRSLAPHSTARGRRSLPILGAVVLLAALLTAVTWRRGGTAPTGGRPPTSSPRPAPPPPPGPSEGDRAIARKLIASGDAKANNRDLDGARADFERAIELDPTNARAWAYRGAVEVRQGNHERAIPYVDKAIALDATVLIAWETRGAARLSLGDNEGAVADFTAAIELDPKNAFAWANRGTTKENQGDHEGAIADLDRAIDLDPRIAGAWGDRGSAKLRRGDLDGAIADLDKAIDLDPRNAVAWEDRGTAKWGKPGRAGALADYERAVALAPDAVNAPALRSRIAELRTGAATGGAPGDVERGRSRALVQSSEARRLQGDRSGAIADLDKAIALDPKAARAWLNRGLLKLSRGELDGAIADLDEAIALDPKGTRAWSSRASAKTKKGDNDGAIADFDRAIALDPKNATLWANRSAAKVNKNDDEGAIADAETAIALDPKEAFGWANRAIAKVHRNDADGAIADFTQAIALDPKNPRVWTSRASVRFKKGDNKGAIADSTEAIARDPKEAEPWGVRGAARTNLGDDDAAVVDCQRFLELAPDHENAPLVRKMLKELRAKR